MAIVPHSQPQPFPRLTPTPFPHYHSWVTNFRDLTSTQLRRIIAIKEHIGGRAGDSHDAPAGAAGISVAALADRGRSVHGGQPVHVGNERAGYSENFGRKVWAVDYSIGELSYIRAGWLISAPARAGRPLASAASHCSLMLGSFARRPVWRSSLTKDSNWLAESHLFPSR